LESKNGDFSAKSPMKMGFDFLKGKNAVPQITDK
jgi:hypothetical protein